MKTLPPISVSICLPPIPLDNKSLPSFLCIYTAHRELPHSLFLAMEYPIMLCSILFNQSTLDGQWVVFNYFLSYTHCSE